MRESIGGMWIFSIAIIFIVLFSAFLAYSISYTKAFNLKNYIIETIEKDEGYFVTKYERDSTFEREIRNQINGNISEDERDKSTEAKSYEYAYNLGYNLEVSEAYVRQNGCNDRGNNDNVKSSIYMAKGGYCVTKYYTEGTGKTQTHYKVKTFIALEIPFLSISVGVPITGETRTLYYDFGNIPEGTTNYSN